MRRTVLLLVGLTVGCGGVSEGQDPEDETDTTGRSSTSAPGSDASQADSESDDTTGTTDSADTTTGSPGPEVEAELIVQRQTPVGLHWYRARVVDGVVEGPALMHEESPTRWESAVALTGRHVVYRLQPNGVSELRLSSAEDPLSAATVALDIEPAGPGVDSWPVAIVGQAAVLYRNGDTLWRVDVDDGSATPPVALSPLAPIDPLLGAVTGSMVSVAPSGAHATVVLPSPGQSIAYPLGLISLADPADPQPFDLTEAGAFASMRGWSRDGDAVFAHVSNESDEQALYIDIGGTMPGSPLVLSQAAHVDRQRSIRPHPQAHGAVLSAGKFSVVDALSYVGIERGEVLPPVPLHDPTTTSASEEGWSPDGRWLAFWTRHDGAAELLLASFGEGHTPQFTSLVTYAESGATGSTLWSSASTALFRAEQVEENLWQVLRRTLDDDAPSQPALVVESTEPIGLEMLSPDDHILVYTAGANLMGVDGSGPEPGEPFVINAPLADGAVALSAALSPDAHFIAYLVRDADSLPGAPLPLMLTDLTEPGVASELAPDVFMFQFVQGWD